MKFAQRLSCAVLLLLAGVFSLGGFVLVYINAADMLRQAAAQVEQWHRMQYYTLETQVLGMMARGEDVTDDALLGTTVVLEHDDGIIAEALRRELDRGGQAYYIHNRIDTIER